MLAGGTGGAKLARGMLDLAGDDLVVIANTGDDADVYGAHVSPDPDLVTFWLADRIDERGWGLRDDTFAVMDALRELGARRLVQPRRPRPRLVPRARAGGSTTGETPTQALAALAARDRRARARAADVRRAGPHARPRPRRAGTASRSS